MAHKMGYAKGSMGKKSSSSGYGMKAMKKGMKHYAKDEAMGGYVEKRKAPCGPYTPR